VSAADLKRWSETPGGRLRAALGVADYDVTVRAKQLLEQEEIQHRSLYGTPPPPRQWAHEAAVAAAVAEGAQIPYTDSYELAARMNAQDPLNRVGVAPEGGSTGFAMAVHHGGGTTYQGDPAAIAQLQATLADAQRRQAAAMANEAHAMGPFYGQVH
jgi:hypothetical protein